MFSRTARFYDAIYSFKDYAKEAEAVHEAIDHHKHSADNLLLDVGCGTGKHLVELSVWYEVEGLDLDAGLLEVARERAPYAPLHLANMIDFDLGRTFDAVVCLFSSIGYAETLDKMERAMANMARHVGPGGVLLIEPWLYRENFIPGHLHMITVDEPDLKIARIAQASLDENVSVIDFHYLIAAYGHISHETESHRLGLYTQAEYENAMRQAGLEVEYDPIGPMGRGMFIGMKP